MYRCINLQLHIIHSQPLKEKTSRVPCSLKDYSSLTTSKLGTKVKYSHDNLDQAFSQVLFYNW